MSSVYSRITTQLTYFLVVACCILLPFNFLTAQISTFILFFWIISPDWKTKWRNIKDSPWVWAFLAFGVLYVLGLLSSDNMKEGAISLQVKLPVFLFPLVFASYRFDERQTRRVFSAYHAGLAGAGMFMLVRAVLRYDGLGMNAFTYQTLTESVMHPSYLALYYVSGVVLLFHGVILRNVTRKKKLEAFILALFYAFMVFLLSSKMGFLSLGLVLLFYAVYATIRFRRYLSGLVAVIVLIVGAWLAVKTSPRLESTFDRMVSSLAGNKTVDPSSSESSEVRMLIWSTDADLLITGPLLGYGTGDVQDELMRAYEVRGMTGAMDKKLNAHSQYFQTALAVGWPGLCILIVITAGVGIWAVRKQLGFLVIIAGLITINMIPESVLQLQAGTMFVGLFYSLLLFSADRRVLIPDDVSTSR